jgi:hypothetical protein
MGNDTELSRGERRSGADVGVEGIAGNKNEGPSLGGGILTIFLRLQNMHRSRRPSALLRLPLGESQVLGNLWGHPDGATATEGAGSRIKMAFTTTQILQSPPASSG